MLNFLAVATLTVRIIGLATVTDKVPNDCGVKVIVPRIEYNATAHASHGAQEVEDHTAFLAVPEEYYDDEASTWKMTTLPAYPGYVYVKLDGDRIRVVTDAANNPPRLTSLKLPKLRNCCAPAGTTPALKPEFQAPYTGAVAVLDVAGGTVTGCRAPASGGGSRYDTEIALNHRGDVKISGDTMKERKEIRLKNLPTTASKKAVVYLANLPTCFLDNTCQPKVATSPDGAPHYHAYAAMMSGQGSCTNFKQCAQQQQQSTALCRTPMMKNEGEPVALSVECSNTQWP